MKYIHITDWDKHQHYKDRRPYWVKLEIDIIDEFDRDAEPKKFIHLPDDAKLTFICLLCLRANYNSRIPYKSDKWLKERLGISKINLIALEKDGYITIINNDTESVSNPYQTDTPENREERIENREKRIYGEFENVKLSKDEEQKLRDKFGGLATRDLIERLSAYLAQSGKKYKSHYATILNWSRRDGNKGTDKSDDGFFSRGLRKEGYHE